MRIIYLHQYFNTPGMPGGTRSFEMAKHLVKAGHTVEMITSWREQDTRNSWFVTEEAGIKVHWLPLPYSNKMTFDKRIVTFIKFAILSSFKAVKLKGDVIFATSTPLTIAIPAIFSSLINRIPMVFEVRDLWPDVPIAMGIIKNPIAIFIAKILELFTYKYSTKIVALAPGMKDAIIAKGIPAEKIHVIPNGCDFDLFLNCCSDKTPNELISIDKDLVKIIYIGTIGIANNVEYIPKLAKAVKNLSTTSKICFYIIGDGACKKNVENIAKELGVYGNEVKFLDPIPKKQVPCYLSLSDATIMTYDGPEILYRDSVSNKFFDSLAAKKAVFANFKGFSTLTASDVGAGFILDKDVDIAAKQLLSIISNKDILIKAGNAAYNLAKERFSRYILASQLESLLNEAVKCKS